VLTVTGIFVYPVKACAAVARSHATVGRFGLEGDRRWMVVNSSRQGVTQRTHPALARVSALPTEDGGLLMSVAGRPEVRVAAPAVESMSVEIWGHVLSASDGGDEVAGWLSDVLGEAVRLAGMAGGYRRAVNPLRDKRGREVSFADGYPLMLCTETSLAELNRFAEEPVPMDRFRPNVVVAGADGPWVEDWWRGIEIGGAHFDVAKPCDRCSVPQVDQQTGERHIEPARVLARHRRGADGNTYFGLNLIHVDIGAKIGVGDSVVVTDSPLNG
jgi:uncharacterized protein YcbX